nr:MAG TPA: hypothetical protein [Caudoviricetes sp.]
MFNHTLFSLSYLPNNKNIMNYLNIYIKIII